MIVARKNQVNLFTLPPAAICLAGVLVYSFMLKLKGSNKVEKTVVLDYDFTDGLLWSFTFEEGEPEDLPNGIVTLISGGEKYDAKLILLSGGNEYLQLTEVLKVI